MPVSKNIKRQALNWYKKNYQKRIVKRSDFSNVYFITYLLNHKLLYRLKRNIYLVKKAEEYPEEVFNLIYWKIVKERLKRYKPYSIRSISAIYLHLGDQSIYPELLVYTKRRVSHTIKLGFGKSVIIRYDPWFDSELTSTISAGGASLVIEKGEKIMFERVEKHKDYLRFLNTYPFDIRLLDLLYEERSRPIVFKNLIKDFQKVGRNDIAAALTQIIKKYTLYRISLKMKKTLRAEKYPILTEKLEKKPWTFRQGDQILEFEKVINKKFSTQIKSIKKHTLGFLLRQAREHKKYDIYHSTTIEGYRISPQEVEEVLIFPKKTIKEKDKEKLRNKMAILGYHYAFDFLLKEIEKHYPQNTVTQNLIKNIFFNLFKPSVESNVIDRLDLVRYRRNQVFIRHSDYIPPSPEKVLDLMENFENVVNTIICYDSSLS
ncbi:hypothetical protein MYX07_03990 [Patescibacteria group bacterium AH-259-L07]|nr:hypothetical protein [Patescibacteria group bacterium AH-259-L07]